MIDFLKKYTTPILGVLFLLSGGYEAIFDDASYKLWLPLLSAGLILLYIPSVSLARTLYNKIKK